MKFTYFLFGNVVIAHTQLFRVGGSSECIRPTVGAEIRNYPIKDVTSQEMVCGLGPAKLSQKSCPVEAGSSLEMIWGLSAPGDGIIDPSHVGPCNVYLVPGERTQQPPKSGWFKIMEGIWDPQNKWCADKLRKDKGRMMVPIPKELKAGNYIIRTEINALHEADASVRTNPARGSQFFIFCADITVKGTGNGVAPRSETVSIPGHLNFNSPGMVYSVYTRGVAPIEAGKEYPSLGPKIASLVQGGVVAPLPQPTVASPYPTRTPRVTTSASPAKTQPVSPVKTLAPEPAPPANTNVSMPPPDTQPVPDVVIPAPSFEPQPVPTRRCKKKNKY
jgi:lytic cellulose monooxygenase (C1-hydroxylating)